MRTVTGKLLTYAIGREMEYYDAPAIRGDRAGGRGRRLPLVVDDSGDREERAVSDEEGAVMIVTKKAISRRTVLRGLGTAVALPLLDAMVPALTAAAEHAGESRPPPGRRLPSERRHLRQLAAEGRRRASSSSRRRLRRSQPFRDKLIVVTGLSSDQAEALGDGGGDHSRASRHVSDRRARQEVGQRRRERHLDGPDCGEGVRARDAALVAAADRWTTTAWSDPAMSATAAPTAARCRGSRRRCR